MIVVFGSINLDLVTRVPRIPARGETVLGRSYAQSPGGKGANQALAASRAGAAVRLVGAVGDDAFGQAALSLLRADGLDLTAVVRTPEPTGLAFITVDDEGRNAITVAAGANAAVEGRHIEKLGMTARDILVLQREVPDEEGETAARAAKACGARIILNLAPSGPAAESYLALIDILIANESEATDLAAHLAIDADGTNAYAALAAYLRRRFDLDMVVTLGAEGAIGWSGGIEHRASAPSVTVIDTTGAGDTFVGTFAAALSEGKDFSEAMRIGVAAGSLACTRRGAQPSIPTREEVDAAMR